MIYLDGAATTQPLYKVDECVWGNPSGVHRSGQLARMYFNGAKDKVAGFLGIPSDNLIITSGGTESNNLAILGLRNYLKHKSAVTHIGEHKSVLQPIAELEEQYGVRRIYLKHTPQNIIDVRELDRVLSKRRYHVGLVCVMYVNNESGAVNNLELISDTCHEHNVLLHSDCTQALGSMPMNVLRHVDSATFSAHKVHGPAGVGALYLAHPELYDPIIMGGGQQNELRSGTENVYGVCGFASVLEDVHLADVNYQKFTILNDLMRQKLSCIPDAVFNVPPCCCPKILSVTFPGVDSETLVYALSENGVMVSSGSACNARRLKHSLAMRGYGLNDGEIENTIRISFTDLTTTDEVDKASEIISNTVSRIRAAANANY